MPRITNLALFECSASFVINFSGELECTFRLDNYDPADAVHGTNTNTVSFIFTRGTNTAGYYADHVSWEVDGVGASGPSGGVSYSGAFNDAPSFSAGPRINQAHSYEYTVTVPDDYAGDFSVTVTIGFVPQ